MTVQCEEPNVVVAVCDGCGERHILDLDHAAFDEEAKEALAAMGWKSRKPERVKYPASLGTQTIAYEQDFCPDCQTGEPRPKPLFGSGRAAPAVNVDTFANDPHDGWPRSLIFEAAGLRPACGHPPGDFDCPHCKLGHPIGHTGPWWRR